MVSFGRVVLEVIEKSDIILEIIDARFLTVNAELEQTVDAKKKILVQVINKCDYLDIRDFDKIKKQFKNCVLVSATKRLGTTRLKHKIKLLASKNKIKRPVVGVVGYPNVGKSSVINSLKGASSAGTSPEPGFTKGKQYLRAGNDFLLIDTPGVITKGRDDEAELVLIGAKNPQRISDPDLAVIRLMQENYDAVQKKYGVPVQEDLEATIEKIAIKMNYKLKGGVPDIMRTSRRILQDWIDGKIE